MEGGTRLVSIWVRGRGNWEREKDFKCSFKHNNQNRVGDGGIEEWEKVFLKNKNLFEQLVQSLSTS